MTADHHDPWYARYMETIYYSRGFFGILFGMAVGYIIGVLV